MNIGVIGGGFGLYGYVPALLQVPGIRVVLPMRYRTPFIERSDISSLIDSIHWVLDDEAALAECEGVVIAVPPIQQYEWVHRCLSLKQISHLFLEKPVAATPQLAEALLDAMKLAGKKFRIGYNFRFTEWGMQLLANAHGAQIIQWEFRAHHFSNNIETWKRNHESGGGAMRFYGIHLIALLSELGYTEVSVSKLSGRQTNHSECWDAEIIGLNLPPCQLKVNSNSDEAIFCVTDGHGSMTSLGQPFYSTHQQNGSPSDQRIPYLVKGLSDLFLSKTPSYDWYTNVNLLWKNIEKRTTLS